MNGWLLDTNVIAEYDKGLHNLPPDSPSRPRIAASIAALEARFAGRILPLTPSIVRRWGLTGGETKRGTSQSPPVIDTMLAATAIEHDLCLVTRNLRDVRHSGALLLNPWDGERI